MISLLICAALGAPLTLDEVLADVDLRVPELAIAGAKLEAARAKLFASRGYFDPTLRADGKLYAGPYERQIVDLAIGGKTWLGPSYSVGYRNGTGDFPTYDPYKTEAGGEWFAKLELPLLDGLTPTAQLAERDRLMRLADAEEFDVAGVTLAIRRAAAHAYWKWVAAGQKLRIERELLEMAESRATALEREVIEGSRPLIDQLDNERFVFERRNAVARAMGDVRIQAQMLSLFYRDDSGDPRVPTPEQLPERILPPEWPHTLEDDLAAAMARPDIQAAVQRAEASERQLRGARNALLPKLSVSVEHSIPVDGSKAETIGGGKLDLPLINRYDRGFRRQVENELSMATSKLRVTRDKAAADVYAAHAALDAALERVEATTQASDRANRVAELERRRLELGAGDVFMLLTREERAARDRALAVDALLAAREAEADLLAVTAR